MIAIFFHRSAIELILTHLFLCANIYLFLLNNRNESNCWGSRIRKIQFEHSELNATTGKRRFCFITVFFFRFVINYIHNEKFKIFLVWKKNIFVIFSWIKCFPHKIFTLHLDLTKNLKKRSVPASVWEKRIKSWFHHNFQFQISSNKNSENSIRPGLTKVKWKWSNWIEVKFFFSNYPQPIICLCINFIRVPHKWVHYYIWKFTASQ